MLCSATTEFTQVLLQVGLLAASAMQVKVTTGFFLSFFLLSIRQILSSPLLIYVFGHPNWRYICIDITQIPKDFIFKAYETVNREIINLNSDIQNSHWIWNYFSIP